VKIKCRFCGWETTAWAKNKKGKPRHGYDRLMRHVELHHPEMLTKVQAYCEQGVEEPPEGDTP